MGVVRRAFTNISHTAFIKIYKALVRSHLEYGVAVWFPYKIKHVVALEAVQRRATRLIPSIKSLPYDERLKLLKLPTLTYRRRRGDMIEVYKLLHGFYNIDANKLLALKTASQVRLTSRNNPLAIYKEFCNKNTRKYSF